MKRRVPAPAAALALSALIAAVVAGCGGSAPDVAPVATDAVTIRDFAFAPANVQVVAGDTVTWSNEDAAPHDVVFDGEPGASQLLGRGATYEATFIRAGVFDYACSLHSQMRGRVTVTEG
jgi:plastocyanin